jgi:AcrR family transcriptional regulator
LPAIADPEPTQPRRTHLAAAGIVKTAGRLVARFGYTKMTIDGIAHAAGLGKGTVYLHFGSKEEIVLAVINDLVRQVFSELRRIAARSEPSAEERCGRCCWLAS